MAIIFKRNKHSIRILRQYYIRKNSEGNDHAFCKTEKITTIPLAATQLPSGLETLMSEKELQVVMRKVIEPARLLVSKQQQEAERLLQDPVWRIKEVITLLETVNQLDKTRVPASLLGQLKALTSPLYASPLLSNPDPLDALIEQARQVKQQIILGHYGRNNSSTVRKDTPVAKKWAKLRGVLLDDLDSILKQLQSDGWVLRRTVSDK